MTHVLAGQERSTGIVAERNKENCNRNGRYCGSCGEIIASVLNRTDFLSTFLMYGVTSF